MGMSPYFGRLILQRNPAYQREQKSKFYYTSPVYGRTEVLDDFPPKLQLFNEYAFTWSQRIPRVVIQGETGINFGHFGLAGLVEFLGMLRGVIATFLDDDGIG